MPAPSSVLAWCLAHRDELLALASALIVVARAIPAPVYARFEARFPRLALLYRAARKLLPDLLPALRALAAAARPARPPALPPPHPRGRSITPVLPLPPEE